MENRRPWQRAVRVLLTLLVVGGALYSGLYFVTTVRAVVAQMDLPFADRVAQAAEPAATPLPGEPAQTTDEVVLPEPEELTERINVLLLGIDQREGETGPWRTDTMILVSMDPVNKTASMLSIPRDLWTTIPGFGESRINTAHSTGDSEDYPGGGPALAKKTVWYALGVPVDNYVRVNFSGFVQLIDAIGGIDVEVAEEIYDSQYPTADYGTEELYIPAGLQHMDGEMALKYARTRHGASDFERMQRQQQVLTIAFEKALSLDFPMTRIPGILALLGSSVQTDLNLQQIVTLANTARAIDPTTIRGGSIDSSITTTVVTPQGWMVEVADWDKVRVLVDGLFSDLPPATVTPEIETAPVTVAEPQAAFAAEQARIAVYNGTLLPDLARDTAEYLQNKGYLIEGYNNADRFDHEQTLLVVYHNQPQTVSALAAELRVDPATVTYREEAGETVDIVVILGQDCTERDWSVTAE